MLLPVLGPCAVGTVAEVDAAGTSDCCALRCAELPCHAVTAAPLIWYERSSPTMQTAQTNAIIAMCCAMGACRAMMAAMPAAQVLLPG